MRKVKAKAAESNGKRAEGRPTDYLPEYCEQVYKLCLLGAIDKQIADFFEIAESTLNNWKKEYPEFMESIKRGKDIANCEIAKSLYDRARGATLKKQVAFKLKKYNENVQRLEDAVEIVEVEEQTPPDTTALIFWLKNRFPVKWRDKQEVEHSGEINLHFDKSYENV